MNAMQIVQAAIPGADEGLVEHIVWGRTPYPCRGLEAKALYRAASGFIRAWRQGKELCDLCNRLAEEHHCCASCNAALLKASEENEAERKAWRHTKTDGGVF